VSSPTKATGDATPRDLFNAFLKGLFLVTAAAWLLLALPLYWLGKAAIVWGVVVGCCLPALCFIVGFYSMCRNFHRPLNKLMMAFFGGMLARMFFIGLAFFLLLLLTQMHVTSLLTSLCGFYFLYLVLELYFVNGRFKDMKEGQQWA
jgi:Ca2+/Na+ antiporter